jgi:pSer/pThr/pTyr-binding forkhead associated (FHA) protein
LKDLESSNGTFVGGERVTKPAELQDGVTIDFGVVVYDDDGETGLSYC